MNAIELKDVFRVHSTPEGDAAALQGLSLTRRRGRGADGARPERLRQVDAAAAARRPRAAVGRASCACTARTSASCPRAGSRRYRSTLLGYADQHYARALAPELTRARARRAAARPARHRRARERLRRADELLERVGLAEKRTAPRDRALGRRAAARRALRRPRTPAEGLPRRRADRRARRRDRRPGVRHALGARARAPLHDRDRQPRPGVGADRRPDRAHPRRARLRGVVARRRRERHDRRRPRRLAAAARGAAAARRDRRRRPSRASRTARSSSRRPATAQPGVAPAPEVAEAAAPPGAGRRLGRRGLREELRRDVGPRRSRRSRSRRAGCTRSPARPARARRRCCTCSPGSSFPTAARSTSPAAT